ncbi:glutamate mutase L [candidate division WOR-3 bacterium]|nr:glutamate mutase L [candidate division WOR-3 bacterium]
MREELQTIVATDCGSTTTKAILIEKKGDEYRLVTRGEAPTTVEAPFEDVTRGVLNAIRELEELTGKKILDGENIIKPRKNETEGVDIYISTSSAGGGLQMMVAGVVKSMTAESAARAALGAGAIVMETIASNDGRLPHQKIEIVRRLRPDMILLSGGVDGGTRSHVAELAELIGAADPRPRFGTGYSLPVIYAGNKEARDVIKKPLEGKSDLAIVDNLRPVLERENLVPARNKIHELFMEHVMAHAPGYKKLMGWTDVPIMPTPGAVGSLVHYLAKHEKISAMGVDIGGATTDVFSVFEQVFNRTVSANLGMSYSISNVLAETGVENITRWVPFEIDERDLRNRIRNKMIRPTTIPQTLTDLKIEQAIAREALRLAFFHHKTMAVGLKGIQQERTISDTFTQSQTGETLVDMMDLNILIGSGGALSHAPRRIQSALMLIDAFLPEGITRLGVDSIFMMPHLGVLAEVNEKAAIDVFYKDCLVPLGLCIAPIGMAKSYGVPCVKIKTDTEEVSVKYGEMVRLPLAIGEKKKMVIETERRFYIGPNREREIEIEATGGVVGVVVDARGRPFNLPDDKTERLGKLIGWNKALGVY